MKIFHTADWHLGQNLYEKKRIEEHRAFLDWLLQEIEKNRIDVLIISGDIYDNGNPPNYAKEEFFNFLSRLVQIGCRKVVIVGGNHDSVSLLNAPKDLLNKLNIHIVGGVPDSFEEQIIEVKNDENKIEAVICAIPFLRDSQIHYTFVSDMKTRENNIKQAISDHYRKIADYCVEKYQDIPLIATGHLYAAKASSSESEKNIYIGNLGKLKAENFPPEFDYIALGHLHRQQKVNGKENIRYSGSPLSMSFSEYKDRKYIIQLEIENRKLSEICKKEIPVFRSLKLVKAEFDLVIQKLKEFSPETKLTSWCEVQITDKTNLTTEERELILQTAYENGLEILAIKTLLKSKELLEEENFKKLDELSLNEVFIQKCEAEAKEETEIKELEETFAELLDLVEEKATQ